MSRSIQLTRGLVAIVDDDDFERISAVKWYASPHGGVFYAKRKASVDGDMRVTIPMHRVIMAAPPGTHVDHVNGDTLDNRRANLRICSARENHQNRRRCPLKPGASMYKGVSWHRRDARWRARIRSGETLPDGRARDILLGYFATELEAAIAYDAAARKHFGPFAACNFTEAK
jgi:hypothetical protein